MYITYYLFSIDCIGRCIIDDRTVWGGLCIGLYSEHTLESAPPMQPRFLTLSLSLSLSAIHRLSFVHRPTPKVKKINTCRSRSLSLSTHTPLRLPPVARCSTATAAATFTTPDPCSRVEWWGKGVCRLLLLYLLLLFNHSALCLLYAVRLYRQYIIDRCTFTKKKKTTWWWWHQV